MAFNSKQDNKVEAAVNRKCQQQHATLSVQTRGCRTRSAVSSLALPRSCPLNQSYDRANTFKRRKHIGVRKCRGSVCRENLCPSECGSPCGRNSGPLRSLKTPRANIPSHSAERHVRFHHLKKSRLFKIAPFKYAGRCLCSRSSWRVSLTSALWQCNTEPSASAHPTTARHIQWPAVYFALHIGVA